MPCLLSDLCHLFINTLIFERTFITLFTSISMFSFQIRMTVAAYQTLYESSIAYGMRKALSAEQGKSQMQVKVQLFIFFM